MAGRNHRLLKQTCRLFASAGGEADGPTAAAFVSSPASSVVGDDFEESDVWGSALDDGGDAGFDYGGKMGKGGLHGARGAPRKPTQGRAAVTASLPVNIPDWSKILREECVKSSREGDHRGAADEDDDDDADGGAVLPPHEYLWRKRGAVASFSVHEGVGRTLKGRDLSRVRNAVWQQTGFQD
ncbi:hypothetical protein Taro_032641 [Colocasia esculenta]|uniref:Senescence regulator n=1 Tax=Colocasia esculenta TaxID=4460 RepID=A0A843W6P7_COLES|nr:hypothetical protein [Colocasia esculenta]